jgi:hypothetical protein
VNQLSDVFRHAELDTILNYMAKQACDALKHKPSKQVKVCCFWISCIVGY